MKNKIFILLLSLFSLSGYADSYYYSKGKKLSLKEDSTVYCISFDTSINSANINRLGLGNKIEDQKFEIYICENKTKQYSNDNLSFKKQLEKNFENAIINPCFQTESGEIVYLSPYLNIRLRKEADYNLLEKVASEYKLNIVSQDKFLPLWYVLSVTNETNGSSLEIANIIYEAGMFAESIADFVSENDALCSYDPLIYQQWGLYNPDYDDIDISICSAWSYATGRGIKIGILDQGVELDHSDLSQNIYGVGFDTESGTSPSKLYGDHGTHCAGIAAAVRNNGIMVAGVAPDAKIVSISNSLQRSANSRLKRADGFIWAYQNGIDIISNSWHSTTEHPAIEEAIEQAFKLGREGKGCIIVFAAGNSGNGVQVSYPANCNDKILAVGAIDKRGLLASFSQTGDKLDVVAPGVGILSTIPNNTTESKSGTSMACPHVAGLAALILERNPSLSITQVNDIIEKNTKKIGTVEYNINKKNGSWNNYYGYGLIDAEKALINTPR